jgi:hypothetical protein
MNKMLNELGYEDAVEPIEQYLDILIAGGILYRWEKNLFGQHTEKSGGWIIYNSPTSDGFNINWNDTERPDKCKEGVDISSGQKVS